MQFQYPQLWVVIIGALSAAAAMPGLKRLAFAVGITARRADNSPAQIPALGGPGIIAGFALGTGVVGMLPGWLVIGAIFLSLVGVIDDAIILTPAQKIIAELLAALVIVVPGPHFSLTGVVALDSAIAGLWLIASANAFNLIDGLDGLAAGVGIIVAAALSIAGAMLNHIPLSAHAAALAGALAAFLSFNFSPASIFMGDGGALPVGLVLGALVLRGAQLVTNSLLARAIFPLMAMMVPVLDTAMVIVSRFLTRRPISRRNRDHAHDRLLTLGLTPRSTAAACWAVELVFACLALILAWRYGIPPLVHD